MQNRTGMEPAEPYTSFNKDMPMGLWDEGRKSVSFKGDFTVIGGSNPNAGFSTWDDFAMDTGNQLMGGGPGQ